jgi:hypothetical protein
MNHKVFYRRVIVFVSLFIFFDFMISQVLLNGLNKYYGINQNPDILINGSSISMSGFNKTDLENATKKRIANFSHEGVSVEERYAMIDYFFHEDPNCVKTVIYEVNPVIFSGTEIAENIYTIFYPYLDNKYVDSLVKERASRKDYYVNKIIRTKRFNSRIMRLIVRGYTGNYENIKVNVLDTASLSSLREQEGNVFVYMETSKIEAFKKSMDLISSHNASIIIVMMPMYWLKLNSFDHAGLEKLKKYFDTYSQSGTNIMFLDLNVDSLNKNPDLFSDPIHFNVYGQRQITNIISTYLIEN